MEKTTLTVEARGQGKHATKALRASGKVPAVLYGREHTPVNLAVDQKVVSKVLSGKAGFNILIDLKISDKETVMARVCDHQIDPIGRQLTHLDFQIVDLKRKIEVEVPLHVEGKAPGVKEGGVLDIQRRTLHIRCLPTSIPEFISVDISALNIGDNIHIDDVKLPEGIECPHDSNFSVVSVVAPHKEEEVVVAAPVEGEAVAAAPGAAPAAGAVPATQQKAPAAGAAPAAGQKAPEKKPAGK